MPAKQINNNGNVVITEEVIAKIAGNAALTNSVGILGMASRSKTDELAVLLKKDYASSGIKVSINASKVKVDIHVVGRYGVNIVTACESLIEQVKYAVETATGLEVSTVAVTVESLMDDEDCEDYE